MHRARDEEIFKAPKIIVPYRSKDVCFAYNEIPWYFRTDIYSISLIKEFNLNIYKVLLGILNSKLCYIWLYFKGKKKGNTLELFPTSLYEIPIKEFNKFFEEKIINLVDRIIELKKLEKDTQDLENQIDEMVYDLYELTEEEKEVIRNS